MPTISLIIEDARFPAPTLEHANVSDRTAAREIAQDRLQASPYHMAVKVREGDELLFWFRRMHGAEPLAYRASA